MKHTAGGRKRAPSNLQKQYRQQQTWCTNLLEWIYHRTASAKMNGSNQATTTKLSPRTMCTSVHLSMRQTGVELTYHNSSYFVAPSSGSFTAAAELLDCGPTERFPLGGLVSPTLSLQKVAPSATIAYSPRQLSMFGTASRPFPSSRHVSSRGTTIAHS